MLSEFHCKSAKSKRVKIWCVLGRRPPKSEFKGANSWKGTCTKQNTSFEPWSVRIGPELRPVGEMWKRKKENDLSNKPWHFTTTWRRHMWTDRNQIVCAFMSRRRNYVQKIGLQSSNGFFRPTVGKTQCVPLESQLTAYTRAQAPPSQAWIFWCANQQGLDAECRHLSRTFTWVYNINQ